MATSEAVGIDRPLRLGELLAAVVTIFGGRARDYLAVGILQAIAFGIAASIHVVAGLALVSVSFAFLFAASTRLVVGDAFGAAWGKVGASVPVLLTLALVVAVPFYLGPLGGLILLLFSAGWLGLTGFAIPAAMVEEATDPGWSGKLTHALRRTLVLARAEYIHAVGVAAALLIIYVLFSVLLGVALNDFADNTRIVAQALAQIVLAPFFFIGLSVLYFEQRARALESPGRTRRRG